MMGPPLVLRIRLSEKGGRGIRMWIPLFLIYPVLFIFTVLLAPVVFFAAAILAIAGLGTQSRMLLMLPRLVELMCALRGLTIDVRDNEDQVYISLE